MKKTIKKILNRHKSAILALSIMIIYYLVASNYYPFSTTNKLIFLAGVLFTFIFTSYVLYPILHRYLTPNILKWAEKMKKEQE